MRGALMLPNHVEGCTMLKNINLINQNAVFDVQMKQTSIEWNAFDLEMNALDVGLE
jgi:hypothetical protein